MQSLQQQLQNNLKHAYRMALDLDALLAQLERQGKGKFCAIFASDAPFDSHARRFMPYVEEMAHHLNRLGNPPEPDQLARLVRQLECFFTTGRRFRRLVTSGRTVALTTNRL